MRRAERHLNELRRELRRFEARKPYAITSEYEPETQRCVFRFNLPRDPSLRWGVIAGDVAHNFHATLDQLVYALSELTTAKPKSTAFPIYANCTKYRQEGRAKIRHVPDYARAMFETFQPYKRPDRPEYHVLEVLRQLSNDDKHKIVPAFAVAPFAAGMGVEFEDVRDIARHQGDAVVHFGIPLEHRAVAGWVGVVPSGPNPEMKMEADMPLHIELLHELPSLNGRSVVTLLEATGRYVANILATFEPVFGGSPPVLAGRP